MTYKELTHVYNLLVDEGFVQPQKPMWDMDFYRILNHVNKDTENYEESV